MEFFAVRPSARGVAAAVAAVVLAVTAVAVLMLAAVQQVTVPSAAPSTPSVSLAYTPPGGGDCCGRGFP
jgi:hypothetical protein